MALLDDSTELKKHNGALASNMDMENVQSYIDNAINKHLIPAIGYEQLTALESAKATDPTEKQQRVIHLLQKSAVGFMLYYWADQGALELTNAGITVRKGTNSAPASDKKIIAFKKQNISLGYDSLEQAITFMENNSVDFPIYGASYERAQNTALLINTSSEFQAAGVFINGDARLYQKLRTFQGNMEETYILPVLGAEIRDGLHQAMLAGTLNDVQKKLLGQIRKAIAFFTMADAIPYMAVTIDSTGIFELSETVGGISGNVENRSSAGDKRLAMAMNSYMSQAESKLEFVRKFLIQYKEDFDYTAPDQVIINDEGSNVYFF